VEYNKIVELDHKGIVCVMGNCTPYINLIPNAQKVIFVDPLLDPALVKRQNEVEIINVNPFSYFLSEPVNVLVLDFLPKCGNKLASLLWHNYKNVLEKIVIVETSYFWIKGFDPANSGDTAGLGEAVADLSTFGFSFKNENDYCIINMQKEVKQVVNKRSGCGCGGTSDRVRKALNK
jgi:hypothetical protein